MSYGVILIHLLSRMTRRPSLLGTAPVLGLVSRASADFSSPIIFWVFWFAHGSKFLILQIWSPYCYQILVVKITLDGYIYISNLSYLICVVCKMYMNNENLVTTLKINN